MSDVVQIPQARALLEQVSHNVRHALENLPLDQQVNNEAARQLFTGLVDDYCEGLKLKHLATVAGFYAGHTLLRGVKPNRHVLIVRWSHGIAPDTIVVKSTWRKAKPRLRLALAKAKHEMKAELKVQSLSEINTINLKIEETEND